MGVVGVAKADLIEGSEGGGASAFLDHSADVD